ncbi:unnamed protein product [Rotaria socialis]
MDIIYWKLYVDDTSVLLTPEVSEKDIYNRLSQCHRSIKFTCEQGNVEDSAAKSLAFLDALIQRQPDVGFKTHIYKKPTFSGQIIQWGSFVPEGVREQKAENSLRKASRKLARAEGELERTEISLVQCQHDFDVAMQTKQIGEQNLQGLPNDDLSIQNGIIATSNYRYPLLIDPQLQGKSWIKDMERDHDLVITTLNSKLFRQQLDDSIAFGRPLLIEDVKEELDPILDPILEKNFSKLDRTLRLYITTKLANPTYAPEICARVSVIDFTVTQRGLEHQLLSLLIANERNELERERVTLARETTKNKRMLKELEDNLLIKLTSSLLDDPSVVEVLNANKRIATEVKEKVVIAEETKMKISTARE